MTATPTGHAGGQRDEHCPLVAVVTGAASGIGATITAMLCERGWNVVGLSRSAAKLRNAEDALAGLPGGFVGVRGDVCVEADLDTLYATANRQFGRICAVVANSGIEGPTVDIANTMPADWQQTLTTNLTGAFLTARAAARYLKANGWGGWCSLAPPQAKTPCPGVAPMPPRRPA